MKPAEKLVKIMWKYATNTVKYGTIKQKIITGGDYKKEEKKFTNT